MPVVTADVEASSRRPGNRDNIMPRNLSTEVTPAQDQVQIGIELEGVGSVRIRWPQELGHQSIKGIEQLRLHTDFAGVFKRTHLVRSPSFTGSRGVVITPEDATVTLGTNHPAELVSQPHLLDEANLDYLRSSVHKALQSNLSNKGSLASGQADTRYGPAPQSQPTITKVNVMALRGTNITFSGMYTDSDEIFPDVAISSTVWSRQLPGQLGGNLQVTCGMSVEQLFRTDDERLKQMAKFIARDKFQERYITLVRASTSIVDALTQQGALFATLADKRTGLQFVVFMFLLHHMATAWKAGYEKNALGANFKGGSSFVGCGVSDRNDLIPAEAYADTYAKLIAAIKQSTGSLKDEVVTQLTSDQVMSKLGQPGLSMQVYYDKWFAIPNFTDARGNLYTVVEMRQKDTEMNLEMCGFLIGRLEPRAFLDRIKPYVFAPA